MKWWLNNLEIHWCYVNKLSTNHKNFQVNEILINGSINIHILCIKKWTDKCNSSTKQNKYSYIFNYCHYSLLALYANEFPANPGPVAGEENLHTTLALWEANNTAGAHDANNGKYLQEGSHIWNQHFINYDR